MLGVIVNTAAVVLGGLIGMLLKKGIPERVSKAAMIAVGLCVLYIGISGALDGENTIVLILAMVFGVLTGTLIDIDGKLGKFAGFIEKKMNKNANGSVAQGFVTGTLLFCVGAMAIVGSLDSGLRGNNEITFTKSLLDLISSCMLASTLGIGVMFAAASIFIYQGALVLLAGALQNLLTDTALINEISCAGSVMIIALGLNMLGISKIKVADFLPALLFVPLFYYLVQLLPI